MLTSSVEGAYQGSMNHGLKHEPCDYEPSNEEPLET